MGCASSTPMIQTTGSEMLKAATHVASDATQTAEDAVEGIKDSVAKTLEGAKESVATTVDGIKHEVENAIKEKAEVVEEAKHSLMEKLHLTQNEKDGSGENSNKKEENVTKTETDEVKTQLNENSKCNDDGNGNGDGDVLASSNLEETVSAKVTKEHTMTSTDTETDSLKTSTPEPEIERALSKNHDSEGDDEDNNSPTPKPTLSELENLTAEILMQQQQPEATAKVNDIKMINEPVVSVMHENIKTLDSNNMMLLTTDSSNNVKGSEPTTTTTASTINDIKSNIMHHTPQISTAVNAKVQTYTKNTQPLLPLTLATSAVKTAAAAVAVTATAESTVVVENKKCNAPTSVPAALGKAKKIKVNKREDKVINRFEEQRPKTTEWEKFADMLAQIRKYNPHDAFRRGGTLTKFGGGGIGLLRERSLGHHTRNVMDDDSSDTTLNSQRSSAQHKKGRGKHLSSRPNTGNNRRIHHHESSTNNGGGIYAYKTRRSSNVGSTTGRKFDFNPTRSRVNDFVSSTPLIQNPLQITVPTQIPNAPYSRSNESVKSPINMRSYHSRNEMITLPPLETVKSTRSCSHKETSDQNHQHHHQQHLTHDYITSGFDHNGSSMPLLNDIYNNETPALTRESSNTSLSSNSSSEDNLQTFKSSTSDVRLLSTSTVRLPVKNSSSFLSTPRHSSFGLVKSYTDLYFSSTGNKEKKQKASSVLSSNDKSPYNVRKSCNTHTKHSR